MRTGSVAATASGSAITVHTLTLEANYIIRKTLYVHANSVRRGHEVREVSEKPMTMYGHALFRDSAMAFYIYIYIFNSPSTRYLQT